MAQITVTGTEKRGDGTIPQDKSVRYELITRGFFADGAHINRYSVSATIDNTTGAFSMLLHVPDDSGEAVLYHFSMPDSTSFYANVSQNSATDWETFYTEAVAE